MTSANEPNAALNYRRHFALLTALVAALVACGWHGPSPLVASMVYATLHALAIAVSLRVRAARWAVFLFIALAAALCAASVLAGLVVLRLGALSTAGDEMLLGVVAAGGASAYLLLLRAFWLRSLPWTGVAGITTAVALVTVVALALELHLGTPSGLWLAVAWWYGLSCGLWWQDSRRALSSAR